MLRACAAVRQVGLPVVAIVSTHFLQMARATARAWDIEVPFAEYPGVVMTDGEAVLRQKVIDAVVPAITGSLTDPPAMTVAEPADQGEPAPREVVFEGSLAQVHEHFHQHLWTDGLPIIPPTAGAVDEFLRHTGRDPGEVLGVLLPDRRRLTVWNVAVNAVMAGCRPEYMPVLLAIGEILADPSFRIEDAGSTPGWEPLVVLSGPIVRQLGFSSGPGMMRVGRQANSSVGRFVRMAMRNVAGLRTPPGQTDKACFGFTFNVAMAENDEAVMALGWEPFRTGEGFSLEDSTVSLQSVVAISPPIYSAGDTAAEHLATITEYMASTMGPWSVFALIFRRWTPLLAISPSVAKVLASAGLSKADICHHIREHARIPAARMERAAWEAGVTSTTFSLHQLVAEGVAGEEYARSTDGARLVPMCPRAEDIGIVVGGDEGRNQSRAYVNNHQQGPRVTRRIAGSRSIG